MQTPRHNSIGCSKGNKGTITGKATGGKFVVDPVVYPWGVSKALHTPKQCKTTECKGKTAAMSGYCLGCRKKHRIAKRQQNIAKYPATFKSTDDVLAFYRSLPQ